MMGNRISEMESGTVAEHQGRGLLIVILLVGLVVVAGAILIINRERFVDNAASVAPVNVPEGGLPPTYTEQHGQITESAAATATADLSRFTTAPGWEQALESSNLSYWGPEREYDLILQEKKYYRSTLAPHANSAAMNKSGGDRAKAIDAFSTEQYGKPAGRSDQPHWAGEREWERPSVNPRAPQRR